MLVPIRCWILLLLVASFFAQRVSALTETEQSEQLQSAVNKGHSLGAEGRGEAAVEQLLDKGLDVNAKDNIGWTSLMMASLEGLPAVLDTLLRRGADPNARSSRGETALILASGCFIVRTRADLVQERGFGADMRTRQLSAPGAMVASLLRRGADVHAATNDGRTALMMAAMHGWADVAEILIAAGARVNEKDKLGRLALDYASTADVTIRDLLLQAGSAVESGRSGRTVCDAQAGLNAIGLRKGYPDCWWGSSTEEQIKQFQKRNELPVSGELDEATVKALKIRK